MYEGNNASRLYKGFMIFVTIVSLLPLTFKQQPSWAFWTDWGCLIIFSVDYILRWITADIKFNQDRWISFARYPFRLISLIDLMAIFALLSSVTGQLHELGYATMLTVFRIIRILRYSKSVRTIMAILQKSKKPLMAVGTLAVGYIMISAIIIFNVEPQTFKTFFDAVYWATVSLTTVGYGDLYPLTTVGRVVAMFSSFFGIAIVALPAGIVTAEYTNSLRKKDE